jgi:hypothetical protein
MSQTGLHRAAVLYNLPNDKYLWIDPQTARDPNPQWSWVTNPNEATQWINILELQYFLADTPIGDPQIIPYPWEVQWMYFHD